MQICRALFPARIFMVFTCHSISSWFPYIDERQLKWNLEQHGPLSISRKELDTVMSPLTESTVTSVWIVVWLLRRYERSREWLHENGDDPTNIANETLVWVDLACVQHYKFYLSAHLHRPCKSSCHGAPLSFKFYMCYISHLFFFWECTCHLLPMWTSPQITHGSMWKQSLDM
jgi:hypothetical protein